MYGNGSFIGPLAQIATRLDLNNTGKRKRLTRLTHSATHSTAAISTESPDYLAYWDIKHDEQYVPLPSSANVWHNFVNQKHIIRTISEKCLFELACSGASSLFGPDALTQLIALNLDKLGPRTYDSIQFVALTNLLTWCGFRHPYNSFQKAHKIA